MARRKRRESFEMALARVIALDELPEKKCTKCGEVKSPAAFSAKSRGRFGLDSMCKACNVEAQKVRQAAYKARNATKDPYSDPTPKRCPGCERTRPRTAYGLNRSAADGLHHICRDCAVQRSRERQAVYKVRNATKDPYADPTLKRCPGCERTLPRTAYQRNIATSDGLQNVCRECQVQRLRERRENYRARNETNDPYSDPTPKRCSDCGRIRPRTDYPRSMTTPDGLHNLCRECNAQRDREQRENRKARNETNDPYSDPTPKRCSDCERTLPRTAYQRNTNRPDGLHHICRECNTRRTRGWQQKNHDRYREIRRAAGRRRRARKRQNGVVPYREEDIFAASDYLCVYCGAPAEEIDHFIPIARGGADAPWNVVATCVACNRGPGGKFGRDPFEFFASRGTHIDWVVNERACGAVEEVPFETLARTDASG